ncbi:uncharacterized protein BJ171DRAFT_509428 [Polychytrium aggregatum]|uniref:uncharacterized protein n=1 Tax=Polychytrium aggregatum TaxID=110093 RepID=UPI0022FF2F15|nr:uncharacterized protein BJ171DRAFT_509428 [Polychytrium aggregatum]KAI9203734.1 hypothetical protein BJ171DRAFT_509428 [Polychytrium aggregatum]
MNSLLRSLHTSCSALARHSVSPLVSSLRSPAPASLGSLVPIRGSKYSSNEGKKLPGYILPKQKAKTNILKTMIRARWFRMRIGKQGQRPRRPGYGHNDSILSKMNI